MSQRLRSDPMSGDVTHVTLDPPSIRQEASDMRVARRSAMLTSTRRALLLLGIAVAAGTVSCTQTGPGPANAAPEPTPLPFIGTAVEPGRVEVAGTGFALTVPDDWAVEVAVPDLEISGAAPGFAWLALRANRPDHLQACNVSVGIATISLRPGSGAVMGDTTMAPHWDEQDRTMLRIPEPVLATGTGGLFAAMAPRERLHDDHPDLRHDVLYVLACSDSSDEEAEDPPELFDELVQSFEILPTAG